MNTNILSCYVANSFAGTEAQQADGIFAALVANLQKATEMTALCKKSLFLVKSHRSAYEEVLKQKESKRRRTAINKQRALVCNHHAQVCAFKHYGQSLVNNIEALAKLMPVLIEDSGAWSGHTLINNSREANTVLCARLIKALPPVLIELYNQFHTPDVLLTAGACGDLVMMRLALFDHQQLDYFAAPLDLIYVSGLEDTGHADFGNLDRRLNELTAIVQKNQEVFQTFMVERSKAFNSENKRIDMAAVQDQQQLIRLVEESNDTVRRYGIAKHACEMARRAVFDAMEQANQALKAADRAHKTLRSKDTCENLAEVLYNNLIAAKCRLVAAEAALQATRVKDEDSEYRVQTSPLRSEAYRVLKESFEAIPARFVLPHLNFLK